MNVWGHLSALVQYGISCGLWEECDRVYLTNQLMQALALDGPDEAAAPAKLPLEAILKGLLDDACKRGLCGQDTASRDLLDTRLMGVLTPPPGAVRQTFADLYARSPEAATDWYYRFAQDTDYIRRYRIKKDVQWKTGTRYGALDITINLSKPEKDPKAIAEAGRAPAAGYPKCLLCRENEGYAGRIGHPARQNLRLIPMTLGGEAWFLQYSPYTYYNEHCIALSARHSPIRIDRAVFEKLLDFVTLLPHYFVGSNADLPIVGGSILSHEHFQGGRCTLPMERAPAQRPVSFRGYADVQGEILRWPMSVLRLRSRERGRLVSLAEEILTAWRGYTDPEAGIFAETEGQPHNTVTPIARRRGAEYELDLVLRNNRTSAEHPLGVFHPHGELHHIKKENIGLIEVMGLAVLPARLKAELTALQDALVSDRDLFSDPALSKHAPWAEALKTRHTFTPANAQAILQEEVGQVFARVLECAGVFKHTPEGQEAFLRFLRTAGQKEDGI